MTRSHDLPTYSTPRYETRIRINNCHVENRVVLNTRNDKMLSENL